jgi:6-phosphogluconate dehydrogenase (decarboxylating)
VGLIGLGIMGSAMSANLMRAGYRVIGYDLLARRLRDHRQASGEVAHDCLKSIERSGPRTNRTASSWSFDQGNSSDVAVTGLLGPWNS